LSVSEQQERVFVISSHGLLNGVFVMSVSDTQQCNLGCWGGTTQH